jgi:hypothetical protein
MIGLTRLSEREKALESKNSLFFSLLAGSLTGKINHLAGQWRQVATAIGDSLETPDARKVAKAIDRALRECWICPPP